MADVSLDDYIVQTGYGQRTTKGFNGSVRGKVVINNPGMRNRLGGISTKTKNISPIKWQGPRGRGFGFGQNKQGQVGLTTKKFAGTGLVTKKFSTGTPTKSQGTNVSVTGLGNYQQFDARQKLSAKKPVDARAKILEKTKFVDARVRIQNARATKETRGPKVQIRSPQSGGPQVKAPAGGNGDIVRTVNNNTNTNTPRFRGVQSKNGGGVKLWSDGELKITKSADFQKPTIPGFTKTISSVKVPSGYEDLFEEEPMSLGSDCMMDSDRGPVIKVTNDHFSSQYSTKPTPITFNTNSRPQSSSYSRSRAEVMTSVPVAPITITRSTPVTVTRSAPPVRQSVTRSAPVTFMHSAQTTYRRKDSPDIRYSPLDDNEDEETAILNAPTPVLPKSRPQPKPVNTEIVGGPPLALSRSRLKSSATESGVSIPPVPAPLSAPLRLSRPSARVSASSTASKIVPQEKITLMTSSVESLKRSEDSGPADILSPLQGFRILVTNLHPIVTQDDVIELFGAIGALKKARLVKQGTAEVVYVNKEAAVLAVKKYHNRELDGQPMQVKLITPVTASAAPAPKISAEIKALTKSVKESGKSSSTPVDTGLIHKALFKTGGATTGNKPVTFTVKI